MRGLDSFIAVVDYVLNTPRKRHITGGILLSASLLFVGLALTVITIKNESDEDASEHEPPLVLNRTRENRTDYSDYDRDDDSY